MAAKVFISQAALSAWVSTDKADVQGDTLTLRALGVPLRLSPASHFRGVSGPGEDRHGLVGKVKDESAIAVLGAEAYMSSVLLGETAYDVESGFLAVPLVDGPAAGAALLEALREAAASL
jgi:hypothetical protein